MKTRFFLLACILLVQFAAKAQMKVGNNPTTINSASLLELETTNKGLVLPRVSISDVSTSSPLPAGLLTGTVVYNTNSITTGGSGVGVYYWDGSKWNFITNTSATSGSYWSLTGNSGLSSSTNFIGTTDAIDFVAKTNNIERMRILGATGVTSQAGWIGMGISVPRSSLDVTGNYSNKNVLTLQNTSSTGYSSVDMMDNTGALKGTFGYGNSGASASFASKLYFNTYGNDFLLTANSGTNHFLLKGGTGYLGLNTNTPTERLHVVGNIYLNGAFMPGGNAGTSGYVLTSTGAGTSPTWTSPNNLSWNLTGNSGTNYATNFLGTTDFVSMRFRTNNIQRMIIDSLGRVGIGLNNPAYALSVLSQINPLYLSGVQATTTFSTDSVLTINGGVVKKTPYSSLTGNFWSLTGNAGTNYTTNYIGTSDNVSLRFRTNNTERMIIDSTGSVGIGSSAFNATNKEKLLVDYGTSASHTLATLVGSIDDYFQVNLQNKNSGTSASTDFVATADDGTEDSYYIDMGINSSNYAPSVENWGNQHDAYLYASSRNLLIGCNSVGSDVIFMVAGGKIKNNTALRIKGENGNIIVGTGEASTTPIGNILRGPNVQTTATNTAGGSLTVQGGSSTGTATGGALNLVGGATSGTGTGGSININGGGTSGGTYGSVNINASLASATNINTGTSTANVIIGNNANNILLPKFNTTGGIIYTAIATGQIASTGAGMTWDNTNSRLGVGITNPGYKLSVLSASDPLYLSGVQATTTFSSDSILTINAGIVKKTPYTSLPGGGAWQLTGNSGTTAGTNFLGTTDAQPLVIKSLGRQLAYFDGNLYSIALGFGAVNGSSDHNVAIGYNATTNNQYTLALGYSATATGVRSVAIGNGGLATTASGAEAIAIGYNAIASAAQTISLGYQATSSGLYGIAIGYGSQATASQSTAIGYSSLASAQYTNAIGYQAQATGLQSTAIGYKAQTAQTNTILLGDVNTPTLYVGIGTATPTAKLHIVGGTTTNYPLQMTGLPTGVSGTDNILTINSSGVVGYVTPTNFNGSYWSLSGNAAASGSFLGTTNTTPLQFKFNSTSAGYLDANNTAFGTSSASTAGTSNTAVGYSATASNSATAIGANSAATLLNNTAIGNSALANVSSQATAIGASSQALYQYNTALGYNAQATVSSQETVIGSSAQAQGQNNIAVGYTAKANGSDKITVVGSDAQGSFQNNTVVGYGALATTNNQSTAIGASAQANAQNATALGYNAKANANNSAAIGYNAQTTTANTLVLGDVTNTSLSVGIGTSTPGNKLEITDGVAGNSGLRFTNLTSSSTGATATNTSDQVLTVNASGDVVMTNGLSYVNTQAGAYTLTAADNQGIVYITSSVAVTITIPSTLPAGFTCAVIQGGTGQLTFSGTGLQNAYSQFKTPNRYASVSVQTPVLGTNVLSGQTSW